MTRREFLKKTAILAGGILIPASALEILSPERLLAIKADESVRWVFLVDTQRCVGCGFCVKACKLENEIPYEADATRTWVERYVVTRDGVFHADCPHGGRDGYTTPELDLNESGHLAIDPATIDKAYFVPKLCNQCDNPPCVQVCPVGATYKTPDGVVLVDRKWCIGCGYCIMACPYGARFFHPTFHRLRNARSAITASAKDCPRRACRRARSAQGGSATCRIRRIPSPGRSPVNGSES